MLSLVLTRCLPRPQPTKAVKKDGHSAVSALAVDGADRLMSRAGCATGGLLGRPPLALRVETFACFGAN